jgi:hypothetical protein
MGFNFLKNSAYRNKLILISFAAVSVLSLLIILSFSGCAPAQGSSEDKISGAQEQGENQATDTGSDAASGSEQDSGADIPSGQSSGDNDSAPASSQALQEPASLNADTAGAFAADGVISNDEYSGYKDMEGVEIYWANDRENAYIAIKAKTQGFVAIGLQPGRTMKDADMIFGFIEGRDVAIYDMFSTGNFGPHKPDIELGGTDDILDFNGNESGGYTIIEFSRKLSTGDKYDINLQTGINKLIWAIGKSDNPDDKHSSRGYGEIEIK